MVLKSLSAIGTAETVDEVWRITSNYLAPLGFQRLNYGLTRYRFGASVGNLDDTLYLTTMSQDYVTKYYTEGFYTHTPIFKWLMNNSGVISFRQIMRDQGQTTLTVLETQAMKLNEVFQIRAGIVISFPDSNTRVKGAIGLFADPELDHDDVDAVWDQHGESVLALCHMMHLKIANLPGLRLPRTLTARQRQALEWVADGKTTQDIALLMGISVAMVEKHLRLARNSLEVDTTAHAVAKGTALKIISAPSPSLPKTI